MRYEILAGTITIESVEAFLREINAIAQSNNVIIQAIDAKKVADRQHVDTAVRHAIRSFAEHHNVANDLGVEILLHLSASRQIQRALRTGVREGAMDVLLIVLGTSKSIEASTRKLADLLAVDPHVIEYSREKREQLMKTFSITEEEINAVGGDHRIPELVRERIALFNAFK
jgi:KEOPS complex subunit Cgi121